MTDFELGKKVAAREILNIIKEISFSKEWIKFRVNYGSNGVRDYIINFIQEKYNIK